MALVKLKKYDPKRGYLLQTFSYLGVRYNDGEGWIMTDDATAEYLSTVREDSSNDESPLAFDVAVDELDAIRLEDAAERRAAEKLARDAGEQGRNPGIGRKVDLAETRRRIAAEQAHAVAASHHGNLSAHEHSDQLEHSLSTRDLHSNGEHNEKIFDPATHPHDMDADESPEDEEGMNMASAPRPKATGKAPAADSPAVPGAPVRRVGRPPTR